MDAVLRAVLASARDLGWVARQAWPGVAAELLALDEPLDGQALVDLACLPQHRADPEAVQELLPAVFTELGLDPPGTEPAAIEAAAGVVAARRRLDPPLADHTCRILTDELDHRRTDLPLLTACRKAGQHLEWTRNAATIDDWAWRLESHLRLALPAALPPALVRALTASCRTTNDCAPPPHPPVDPSAAAVPLASLAQPQASLAGRPTSPRPPARHPAFRAHFRGRVYTDYASEFAPFGHDDGADLLNYWSSHATELGPHSTLTDVISRSDVFDEVNLPPRDEDAAFAVTSAAFTLLRFTGRIAAADHAHALHALDFLIGEFGEQRDLARMRVDLAGFPPEH